MSNLPNPTAQGAEIITAWNSTPNSLMIEAYAGCGKTTLLQQLAPHIKENLVLFLAFNKKNAEDFKTKLPLRFDTATMNSIGHRALSAALGRLDVQAEKNSKILKDLAPKFGYERVDGDDFTAIMALISGAKSAGLMPSTYPQYKRLVEDDEKSWRDICDSKLIDFNPEMVQFARAILSESVRLTLSEHLIDYDDQIFMSTLAVGAYKKYQVVGVDEAQDLSLLNHLQLRKSLMAGGRLIVVGDPKQAIYAFRGASSKSMGQIEEIQPGRFTHLPLSLTFRCPRTIVQRNQAHAPGFEAHSSNRDGSVIDLTHKEEWSLEDLPSNLQRGSIAILCRNNAPLLSAAFRLIRARVGVTMLGRDIGKSLIALLHKIVGKKELDLIETRKRILAWQTKEVSLAIANGRENKIDLIEDRAGCLLAVIEGLEDEEVEASTPTSRNMEKAISDLFSDQSGLITLGSAHRAKGLEWPIVVHLDPFRLPSRQAKKALEDGNATPMEQEKNLQYVLETRTQDVLVLANLKEFQP